VNRIV